MVAGDRAFVVESRAIAASRTHHPTHSPAQRPRMRLAHHGARASSRERPLAAR